MTKVRPISLRGFRKKFDSPEVDLVASGFFTEEDFQELEKVFGYLKGSERADHLLRGISLVIKNPTIVLNNFQQIIGNQLKDFKKYAQDKERPLKERYPISDYINKASIVAGFKPKNILEIGTYFGWGAASIKAAAPKATVYTMNPKETEDANNPIELDRIGEACKRKNMQIKQIWADSTKYDYSKLPKIDVTYIDGNHEYAFVLNDLEKTSAITKKALVLDDYIPSVDSPRGDVRAWGPWNESVVKATDDFLTKNKNMFKFAYWIRETPICVLIK